MNDEDRLTAQADGTELAALNARTKISDIVGRLQAGAANMPHRPHADLDTTLDLMDELADVVVGLTVDEPALVGGRTGSPVTAAWAEVCDCSCGGIRR